MKKAPALITIAVIVLVSATIVFLSQNKGKIEIDSWQLVPRGAVAVVETTRPQAILQMDADTSGVIKFINAVGASGKISNPYLFCFQASGKRLEWAAIMPKGFSSPLDTAKILGKTLNQRTYEGKHIYELRSGKTPWVTFAKIDQSWVASRNSVLVEAIVRQSLNPKASFKDVNGKLFSLSTVQQDDGNLYLNWSAASSFVNGKSVAGQNLSHSLVLDLKWNEQGLQGNGFAVDTSAYSTLLSTFTNQKPAPVQLRKVIPAQFSRAVHFGFSDPPTWYTTRDKVYASAASSAAVGLAINDFAKAIDDEMMYCEFGDGHAVVVVELKEITRAQTQLEKMRNGTDTQRETYADRVLYSIAKENALASVIRPFSFASPSTAYAIDDNLLLISNSTESIKKYIDFNDSDQTIGKSIGWIKFLEATLSESNVSVILNNSLQGNETIDLGFPLLSPIEHASFQFYALSGNYYASALVKFGGQIKKATETAVPSIVAMKLNDQLLGGPWLVRNHAEPEKEILLQDAAFRLVFMDRQGKIRWTKNVAAEISGGVKEIDYFKNGKIQYLFCTADQLHIIDRLGNYVSGFPKKVNINPQWVSLVDYDKSRNYRIVLADKNGKIVIVDKDGATLDGWQNKSLGREFVDAPTHYRIDHRDYYVAASTDGKLHLFSRRGDAVAPFPISAGFGPSGDVFCEGSSISVVSAEGMLIKINTKGEKIFEEPIIKNTTAAGFRLVSANDRSGFIVTRLERGNLAVFDSSGKLRFEIVNPLSDSIEVQYFRASEKAQLFLIRDVAQGLLYALDRNGKALTPQPVQAPHAPVADLDENSGRLFFMSGDTLAMLELSLP